MQDNNIYKTKEKLKAYNDSIRVIEEYNNLQNKYQRYQRSLPKAEQEWISSKASLEETTNALKIKKQHYIKRNKKERIKLNIELDRTITRELNRYRKTKEHYEHNKKMLHELNRSLESLKNDYQTAINIKNKLEASIPGFKRFKSLQLYIKQLYFTEAVNYKVVKSYEIGSEAFDASPLIGIGAAACAASPLIGTIKGKEKHPKSIGEYINCQIKEEFYDLITKFIDRALEQNLFTKESKVYERAGCPRQQYSKMKNEVDYKPTKHIVLSYALALRLNHDETLSLLEAAGFTLSNAIKYDLIINYCIINEIFDFDTINTFLIEYGYEKNNELFNAVA